MSRVQGIKFVCDHCGALIEVGRPRFILKGELYCAYDGAQFDEMTPYFSQNLQAEIKKLIEIAESKSEKELTDEVHYPFHLDLCRSCRDKIYQMIDQTPSPDF